MEQCANLLAVERWGSAVDEKFKLIGARGLPAGSRLAPLTLESSNALLPPLGSHLHSS